MRARQPGSRSLAGVCTRTCGRGARRASFAERNGPLPGSAAAAARGQLVEPGHLAGPGGSRAPETSSTSSAPPTACIRTSAAPSRREPEHLRDALRGRDRGPAEGGSGVRLCRRERRCEPRRPARAIRSIPFRNRRSQNRTGSKAVRPGMPRSGGDRHMLIVDRDNRHLYELFALRWTGSRWEAGSGAFFDLDTNARRPEGWTSADAAGLAILPGLVRYDEAFGPDEIRHAFRVTVHGVNNYVWPASHRANTNSAGAAPRRTAAAEAGHQHQRISGLPPEDLPRHEDPRPHRRRHRIGHVHERRVRHALGQRPAEPGLSRDQGQRLRGHPAGLAWKHRALHGARRTGSARRERDRPRGVVWLVGANHRRSAHRLRARSRPIARRFGRGHRDPARIDHRASPRRARLARTTCGCAPATPAAARSRTR